MRVCNTGEAGNALHDLRDQCLILCLGLFVAPLRLDVSFLRFDVAHLRLFVALLHLVVMFVIFLMHVRHQFKDLRQRLVALSKPIQPLVNRHIFQRVTRLPANALCRSFLGQYLS